MTPALELAAALPDAPRWIDTRGMLRSGHAAVTGGASVADGFVVRLVHGALSAIAVVGRPPAPAIAGAVPGVTPMTPVIAQTDNAEYVGLCLNEAGESPARWRPERVLAHRLEQERRSEPRAGLEVRLLRSADALDHLPPGLRHEITHARALGPVACVVVRERVASLCYACWTTETLWDVSIDTLDEFRGQGLAGHAVWFMVDRMRAEGREPVWCALESNAASLRVAARLGFVPVEEMVVFSRGAWAFLTGGFQGEPGGALADGPLETP